MLWFWGLAGAFIFAAPELTAGLFEDRARANHAPRLQHILRFVVALATGAICAESFSAWVLAWPLIEAMLKNDDPASLRGIATMIGLIANSAAPGIVRALNKRIVKKIEEGERP